MGGTGAAHVGGRGSRAGSRYSPPVRTHARKAYGRMVALPSGGRCLLWPLAIELGCSLTVNLACCVLACRLERELSELREAAAHQAAAPDGLAQQLENDLVAHTVASIRGTFARQRAARQSHKRRAAGDSGGGVSLM